jgi:predicted PurR-regulated permease PerM
MDMERDRWLSVVLRTGLLVLFFWMIKGVIVPVALGGLFALLLSPLLGKLSPRLGKGAPYAPLLLTVGTIVLVVIPFVFVVVEAVQTINEFAARDWGPTVQRVQAFLRDGFDIRGRSIHIGGPQLQAAIQNIGQRVPAFAAGIAGGVAAGLPEVILGLFLFAVAIYYGLREGEALGRWMARLSPFPTAQTRELFHSVRETVNGAILGLIVTALVQGSLTLLALYLCGVPNAFLLGVIATLLSFIPLIGTTPVTIGSAIYLFVVNRYAAGVGMLVAAVVVGLSDNVVRPWVQSSRTRMHPLIALVSIFGGLELFGAVGVFLGPVVAAMAVWTIDNYAKLHPPRRESAASLPETTTASGEPPTSQKL